LGSRRVAGADSEWRLANSEGGWGWHLEGENGEGRRVAKRGCRVNAAFPGGPPLYPTLLSAPRFLSSFRFRLWRDENPGASDVNQRIKRGNPDSTNRDPRCIGLESEEPYNWKNPPAGSSIGFDVEEVLRAWHQRQIRNRVRRETGKTPTGSIVCTSFC